MSLLWVSWGKGECLCSADVVGRGVGNESGEGERETGWQGRRKGMGRRGWRGAKGKARFLVTVGAKSRDVGRGVEKFDCVGSHELHTVELGTSGNKTERLTRVCI